MRSDFKTEHVLESQFLQKAMKMPFDKTGWEKKRVWDHWIVNFFLAFSVGWCSFFLIEEASKGLERWRELEAEMEPNTFLHDMPADPNDIGFDYEKRTVDEIVEDAKRNALEIEAKRKEGAK